jgi:hypothetical protein
MSKYLTRKFNSLYNVTNYIYKANGEQKFNFLSRQAPIIINLRYKIFCLPTFVHITMKTLNN